MQTRHCAVVEVDDEFVGPLIGVRIGGRNFSVQAGDKRLAEAGGRIVGGCVMEVGEADASSHLVHLVHNFSFLAWGIGMNIQTGP